MLADATAARRSRSAVVLTVLTVLAAVTVTGAVRAQPKTPYPTSPVHAGPCPVSAGPPCTLVLAGADAPRASASCSSPAWSERLRFTLPDRWTDSNRDGYWEAVLEVVLDPARDCGCMRVRAFYGNRASNWTLHVGNSPTNNGHGGDEGTTPLSAELQVVERSITVYTVAQSGHRSVDRLFEATMPTLAERILDIEICNQYSSVTLRSSLEDPAPLTWKLETLNSKLLFSLGPEDLRRLWLGLNRVVHRIDGAASHSRTGTGLRSIELTLDP